MAIGGRSIGAAYLRRVAPFYGFVGLGMALYFASQGAGRVFWPMIASVVRMLVATVGGWYWVAISHGAIGGLFWIVVASLASFGLINAATFAVGKARNKSAGTSGSGQVRAGA